MVLRNAELEDMGITKENGNRVSCNYVKKKK